MSAAELPQLSEQEIADSPRVGLLRLVFGFLLQQGLYGTASMMVAELISEMQRLEQAERSGNLSVGSVKSAANVWRREVTGFKYWFGAADDKTITRLMRELTGKGMQTFVSDLAVELQVSRPAEAETP